MPKLKAADILPGMVIVLQDNKTRVTVTEIGNVIGSINNLISISWDHLGQRRYMAYSPDDEIEVIS